MSAPTRTLSPPLSDDVLRRAAMLRVDCLPYTKIAEELGLINRKAAHSAVQRALARGYVRQDQLPPPAYGGGRGRATKRILRMTPLSFDAPPTDDTHWRRHGACQRPGLDPARFYPSGDDWTAVGEPERAEKAKAICSHCPVEELCLQYALASRDPWAVLGGTTPAERDEIRARDNSRRTA